MPHTERADPSLEASTVTHLRAALLRGFQADLARSRGASAWADLVDSLSPEGQALFRDPPPPRAWIPTARINELVEAYQLRIPEPGRLGRVTADDQFTVVHTWLLKLMSPSMLMRQVPMIFRMDYRGGVVRVDALEPGHARLSLWAEGLFPAWYAEVAPRWLVRGLELSGGGTCAAVHTPAGPDLRHRYDATWSHS